jgi:SAM-dependent methyltransferase
MGFDAQYQDGAYLAETGDWHEGDAAWKAEHIRAMIDAAKLAPARIADVGCGTGGVLAQLQARLSPTTEYTGFEIAKPAFQLAEQRANARLGFVNGSPLDHRGEPYDLMLALDVFEHVEDYLGFLQSLRPLAERFVFHIPLDLSARGLFIDLPMHRRRTVGHLHYFTTSTAEATLRDCGYRILRASHTHAMMQPPPAGWKMRVRSWPHRALFRLNPGLCATVLGGCSLLVLAEPEPAGASVI